jgi:hypothetical protein
MATIIKNTKLDSNKLLGYSSSAKVGSKARGINSRQLQAKVGMKPSNKVTG